MVSWNKTLLIAVVFSMVLATNVKAQSDDVSTITVKKTKDFSLNGLGDAAAWKTTSFTKLQKKSTTGVNYSTQFKILYSDAGIYCLYLCEDSIITSTLREDFADLYNEDVVEAFFCLMKNRFSILNMNYRHGIMNYPY